MRQLKINNLITNRDSDTIEKYFNDIARVELLAPGEEAELARRIKAGDQMALEKLVKANLRFVVSVAKQYHHHKVPLNDLINEGNVGLIKAARMFDETKGFKFISYAVWWIRQAIMDSLDKHSRIVRVPANKVGELSKISQATSVMEQKFEREPTHEELADFLGLQVEDLKTAHTATIRQSSLDAPLGEEDSGSLLDIMQNTDEVPTDAALSDKESLQIELDRILSTLTSKEKEIICRLFGIGYEYNQTIEDVAEHIGVSHERVRQIKEGALRKLRSCAGKHMLQLLQ